MKKEIKNLIEDGTINEPEIVDLISVIHKLVNAKVLKEKKLNHLCDKLGITRIGDNTFEFEDGVEYTLN